MTPRLDRSARALLSGERRGPVAALLRAVLLSLTPLYRLTLLVRRLVYAIGIRRPRRPSLPVVSVGNLTAGGTGKTPFVAHLVRWFASRDLRAAVVARGYAARPGETSDEARMLREAVPGVLHVEDRDRARGAARAASEGADVVVLDDGFQHWACARDLDLVLIDATAPFGYGRLLPRGLLREPVRALRRADVLVVTRADQVAEDDLAMLARRLRALAPDANVVVARHAPVRLVTLDGGESRQPSTLADGPILALSAIGHPSAFERTLADLGARVVGTARHPDHHVYVAADLRRARRMALDVDAEAIVTTTKDAVKLRDLDGEAAEIPVLVLEVEIEILDGGDRLESRLERLVTS